MINGLVRTGCVAALIYAHAAFAGSVSNSVVLLTISGARGGSIDSFKIVGNEVVNTADLGREIQASLFFEASSLPPQPTTCTTAVPPWLNPQEAGDECGVASSIYAIGTTGNTIDVGTYPREWAGRGTTNGLRIEGHHTVGPLPYVNAQEVTQLKYQVYWDAKYQGQPALTFTHSVYDGASQPTPVPFVPAAYYNAYFLPKLYGLSIDGSTWVDLTSSVSTAGTYKPSLYRFRAVAWMRSDLGYGIAFYSRWTMDQTCTASFQMTLPSQSGQCPNFAAQSYPSLGTNNLSVVDQSLTQLSPGTGVERVGHAVVGNLGTIQSLVNQIYDSGH